MTFTPERPSFRTWQTTRLPEPHRSRCAAVWRQRDLDALVSAALSIWDRLKAWFASVARAVTESFRPILEAFRPMIRAFEP